MLQNYLKIAFRHFLKYKTNSFINVFGLSIGIACAFIIGLYVLSELSFDQYHAKKDRVFLIGVTMTFGDKSFHAVSASGLLKPELETTFGEIEAAARLDKFPKIKKVNYKDQTFWDDQFSTADPAVFDIFDFSWLKGNQKTALNAPFQTVLTESLANKYFGAENPIGKTLNFENDGKEHSLEVTGLIADLPNNTHLDFQGLVSFETHKALANYPPNWTSINNSTYILLNDPKKANDLTKKINDRIVELEGKETFYKHFLQPLSDVHLNTLGLPLTANGDLRKLKIFGAIAFLILLIACINFMNLTTARATIRFKEVGVRKALGAKKNQLVAQFMSEAMLYTLLSVLIAMAITDFSLPFFNDLFGVQISFSIWEQPIYFIGILGAIILIGLFSGSYPAFHLSRFNTIQLRSSWSKPKNKGFTLRRVLVVGQFFVSILLIISTLVIFKQMQFMQNLDLGFDKEEVLYLPLKDEKLMTNYEMVKNEFEGLSEVQVASVTSCGIGEDFGGHGFQLEAKSENPLMSNVLCVDDNYQSVMNLEMKSGRWFDPNQQMDSKEGFILNESAVKYFGFENPIGAYLNRNGQEGKVIGVVQDFHYEPLHQPIKPVVLYHSDLEANYAGAHDLLILKLASGNLMSSIDVINQKWESISNGAPFEYQFLDEHIAHLYEAEYRFGKLVSIFTFLAILVACLGLLGLAAFAAQQRTKEIGIRKVLGASAASVIGLLSKDFLKLVIIALILASPTAYYFMENWLEDFAYHIDIQLDVFAISGIVAVLVAFLTVSFQSLKAALANPINSLRNE